MGQPLDAYMVAVLPVRLSSERDSSFWESRRRGSALETAADWRAEACPDREEPAEREGGGCILFPNAEKRNWTTIFTWNYILQTKEVLTNQEAGKQPSSPVPKSQLTTVVDLVERHLRDTLRR